MALLALYAHTVLCHGASPPPPPQPIRFFSGLTDWAVLQRAPAKANVYGVLGDGGTAASVTVTSATGGFAAYTVAASTDAGGGWTAALRPAASGGDVSITATCTGCRNATAVTINHVTFGDVFYCAGQSAVGRASSSPGHSDAACYAVHPQCAPVPPFPPCARRRFFVCCEQL